MLRVESVKIQRFRGIREGELSGLVEVNLLVGRNNSGKTTVVEGLSRILGSVSPSSNEDPLSRKPGLFWHNVRKHVSATPAEMWYRSETSKPIELRAKLGDVGQALKIDFQSPGMALGSGETMQTKGSPGPTFAEFAKQVTIFRPPDAADQEIEKRLWTRLLSKRADKKVVQSLNDIFGATVEQLTLPPDGRMMLLFSDYGVPLDVQGDGTRAALRCLFVLAALQGTLLILEEPESHQHPGSLERFGLALCKQAKAQEVQLIITTHSVECLRAFLNGAAQVCSDAAVFHLQLQDGLLDSRRLDPGTVASLLETGVDIRCLDLYV